MSNLLRRDFLKMAGLAPSLPADLSPQVVIVTDPDDHFASSEPVAWAASELRRALEAKGVQVEQTHSPASAVSGGAQVFLAGPCSRIAREQLRRTGTVWPDGHESFTLAPAAPLLLAAGSDVRGLSYATLELADRVRFGLHPMAAFFLAQAETQSSVNPVRSIARCFESDVEDKSWYYDKTMWTEYLAMLAAQRINRFSMTYGLGYNWPMPVTDVYLYFTYPFLLSVPGYGVRVRGLPDQERKRNFDMLHFIGEQTVKRGMQFQVGLWTHAYTVPPKSNPNYVIDGLSPENHAAYCRDALNLLLESVPSISGITFRIHGESGIPEGDYDFWTTVFEGIRKTGRRIEIDMHAKGMDFKMIDVALATGMPVKLSPKYWAEHMGLGYHQAAIRELEMPPKQSVTGQFALSNGSRKFLRYGYGDLLKEDRRYGILHRIWPGTQRALLWGDPEMAAAYGRTAHLCGSDGVEWCEPLSFKGRMGTGHPGGRCAYSDTSLNPKYDWQKFEYTYRVWGRLLYDPSASPEGWRRYLSSTYQAAAPAVEASLANASRILPLITTSHGASGSNNTYWPEMYTNMPIVDAGRKQPYGDTPAPKVFGNVSPFDPQLFATINEQAGALLKGVETGKYSPAEVAQWLEDAGNAAEKNAREAEGKAGKRKTSPEFRRFAIDAAIQAGIGRFFAWKIRSALLWEIYERSGDPAAGEEAISAYGKAREAWAKFSAGPASNYVADVSYGPQLHLRGNWADRLPAIDQDLGDMKARLSAKQSRAASEDAARAGAARRAIASPDAPPAFQAAHTPPASVRAGETIPVELSIAKGQVSGVVLQYRRVNQAEAWMQTSMQGQDGKYTATIPGEYTSSPYPLQYYFQLHSPSQGVRLYPGLGPNLAGQPYYVVRLRSAS